MSRSWFKCDTRSMRGIYFRRMDSGYVDLVICHLSRKTWTKCGDTVPCQARCIVWIISQVTT
jgi:hypothetical protein